MAAVRDSYGNTPSTGYTINWFNDCAHNARNAFLASPFFTTFKPIETLTQRGCEVSLLVRLCSITVPVVLRMALADPRVRVRYYTDRHFHAKLYIIDDTALVGSANLTEAGLMTNREVSVVLRRGQENGFDDLGSLFDLLWSNAITLTPEILTQYEIAFRQIGNPSEDESFQKTLEAFVPAANVPNAKAGSEKVSKERAFLEKYHRKYDEMLIPAFHEVERVFSDFGKRRPEFANVDPQIELGRFLGWARLVNAPGDSWMESTLADADERRTRVLSNLEDWITSTDTKAGDMYDGETEVFRINRLRKAMASEEKIHGLEYDELFHALLGVHAFNDRLRHVSGGEKGLKAQFIESNSLDRIKQTLAYLIHGPGISLERSYDTIQNEKWKLAGFAEGCVMELLGWMDPHRPPINGRTIKALRFFGFDARL